MIQVQHLESIKNAVVGASVIQVRLVLGHVKLMVNAAELHRRVVSLGYQRTLLEELDGASQRVLLSF